MSFVSLLCAPTKSASDFSLEPIPTNGRSDHGYATSLQDEAKDDHLLLWILVWSELIAFGILILGFLVVSTFDAQPSNWRVCI